MVISANLGAASTAAVKQYCLAAQALGIDYLPILDRFGLLDNGVLTTAEHIEGKQMQSLLKALLDNITQPCFGLFSGQFVRPESYSILGLISMNASSLGEVMEKAMPLEKLVGDMGTTRLIDDQDNLLVRWHCLYDDPQVVSHMVDNVFASWVYFTRWLTGQQELSPNQVHFAHPCPEHLQSEYQAVFNCPVLFQQPHDQLVIDKALLKVPIQMPNASLLAILEQQAQQQVTSLTGAETVSLAVKKLLETHLKHEELTRDKIAGYLFMSGRTLQRKLEQEGTQFRTLVNEVRLSVAKQLLKQSNISSQQLAFELGFAEASSMQRWFKNTTGYSLRHFAKQQL